MIFCTFLGKERTWCQASVGQDLTSCPQKEHVHEFRVHADGWVRHDRTIVPALALTSGRSDSLQYSRLFLVVTLNSPESPNTPFSNTSTVYIVEECSRSFTARSIPHFRTGLMVQLPKRDCGYPIQFWQSSQLSWPQEPIMAGSLASITSSLSWSAKLSMYGQGLERQSDKQTIEC
jgi:hypothetical protein